MTFTRTASVRPGFAARLKPAGKAPPPKERAVQREIVSGLRKLGLRVVAVSNGGQYSGTEEQRIRMAMAKRMDGEVAGFPDLIVMTAKGPPRVAFLEVKRLGANLTTETVKRQITCHDIMRADGHMVAIVDSLDAALDAVTEWGLLSREPSRIARP